MQRGLASVFSEGRTGQPRLPTGTYGRAILNRLLIDVSWALNHEEGNTLKTAYKLECLSRHQLGADQDNMEALVIEDLRRVYEGFWPGMR